ncbi:MAG TPA: Ig-like domain-containing protein, partial [Telluria sp.]|nr:Ig-like domain-containing protein [Telluria sp.]
MHSYDLARRAGVGLLALTLAAALSACGGGGGNPGLTSGTGNSGSGGGTGTTTPATPTVTLAFVNGSGQSTNALSSASQLTVKATVKDKDGKVVPNALVTFATDPNLAVFSPTSGTALTDANGVASMTMRAASLASGGAGTVTVTSTVSGSAVTGTGNYSVGATSLTFGALTASPTAIQAYGSTVLSVDLLAGGAKYTAQQVNVNFSSACVTAGKATLAAVVPTNNGTAQTVYRDQGCGNNDVITVTATGVDKSVTQNLAIASPAPASVQFAEAAPTDKSIVIQGQGGNGRTETATLKFRVFDIFNRPLAGRQVNFSASTSMVRVNKSTDTTDQNGEVITTVNSGSVPTTFRVLATLPGTASGGNP